MKNSIANSITRVVKDHVFLALVPWVVVGTYEFGNEFLLYSLIASPFIVLATILFNRNKTKLFGKYSKQDFLKMSGWTFEEKVGEILRKYGYEDVQVTKGSGDGGVDIVFYKFGDKYIAQCKNYSSKVGPAPFRELYGVRDDFNADRVVMIASSGATAAALSYIKDKKDFILWTLEDIIRMSKNAD